YTSCGTSRRLRWAQDVFLEDPLDPLRILVHQDDAAPQGLDAPRPAGSTAEGIEDNVAGAREHADWGEEGLDGFLGLVFARGGVARAVDAPDAQDALVVARVAGDAGARRGAGVVPEPVALGGPVAPDAVFVVHDLLEDVLESAGLGQRDERVDVLARVAVPGRAPDDAEAARLLWRASAQGGVGASFDEEAVCLAEPLTIGVALLVGAALAAGASRCSVALRVLLRAQVCGDVAEDQVDAFAGQLGHDGPGVAGDEDELRGSVDGDEHAAGDAQEPALGEVFVDACPHGFFRCPGPQVQDEFVELAQGPGLFAEGVEDQGGQGGLLGCAGRARRLGAACAGWS